MLLVRLGKVILALVVGSASANSAPLCQSLFSGSSVLPLGSTTLRVAAVQYPLEEAKPGDRFLEKISNYINEAKSNHAELVVFPELVTTELIDWHSATPIPEQMRNLAHQFTPSYINWIEEQARLRGIAILGGTTPREVGNEIRNTAVLALPNGRLILQDKIFLTPEEKHWGWSPGQEIKVFTAPWGKTVITTCFDCEYPLISNSLVRSAPELWLIPSWTSSTWGLNRVGWSARARAIEQFAYIVRTGTVPGPGATQAHEGQASIIGPQDSGFPIQTIEGNLNQPQVVYADLNFGSIRSGRQTSGFYPGKEQLIRTTPINVTEVP